MEKFVYKAYDRSGAVQEGEIQALNIESAKYKLKESGFIPVKVDPAGSKMNFADISVFEKTPGLEDIEFFSSKIALLLKNGIKIDSAFDISRKNIKNKKLKKIIEEIYEEIRRGTSLSESLKKYPEIFDGLYISIVSIGEASGNLPEAFSDIAANLSFRRNIRAQTRQAMIYPAIIMFVCLGAILFIFNYIVPKFSVIFAGIEDLPVYTDLLLTVSAFFREYQVFIGIALAVLIIVVNRIKDNRVFKQIRDLLVVKTPIIKDLSYTLDNLRFASALTILLKSGVVISDALEYAVNSVSNLCFRKRLLLVKEEVRRGNKFSEIMEKTSFLPDTFDGLLEVGEQTGNLGEIFSEMETRLKIDYENNVAGLITVIEPLMILIMGVIVGSIVVVMLLSMVSINDIDF